MLMSALYGQQAKPDKAMNQTSTPTVSPVVLTAADSKVLKMPFFYSSGISQCDADGDLYFNTARNFNDSVILKLTPGGDYSLYVIPADEPKDNYFIAYRVDPEGTVYVLVHAGLNDKLYLYEFSSDSVRPSRVDLQIPAGLETLNFLVLPGQHILLQGYFTDKAVPENEGRSYLAYFAPSGKLIRDSLHDGSDVVSKDLKAHSWALTAAAVTSDNGQSYMLSGNNMLVFSSAGELVKTMHLDLPGKNARPVNVFAVGGRVLVSFFKKPDKGVVFIPFYELLDGDTGEMIRTYVPDEEMGNVLACFSKEGFTFVRPEKHHVKLIVAKPG